MTEWTQITAAIAVALNGEREEGRHQLLVCWQTTTDTDHAQRCVLAHYLADLEADLADEVAWDERALAAYHRVSDTELAPIGITSAAGLAPSLHLNLGHGYLRQGRVREARTQLDAGLASSGTLADDGYGNLIRRGLNELEQRVAAAETEG